MIMFFWVVMPCRLVGRYQRLGETYCLRLQIISLKRWYLPTSPHDVTTQNNNIDIFIAVRTSNITFLLVSRGPGSSLGQYTTYSGVQNGCVTQNVLTRAISSPIICAAEVRPQHVSVNRHDMSHVKLEHSKVATICHQLKPSEIKSRITPSIMTQNTNTIIVMFTLRLRPRTRGFPVM
jgi:hypothetical protein